MMDQSNSSLGESPMHLDLQLDGLLKFTDEINQNLCNLYQEIESYARQYHEHFVTDVKHPRLENCPKKDSSEEFDVAEGKQTLESMLKNQLIGMVHFHTSVTNKLENLVHNLESTQTQVLNHELVGWKRQQQLYGNGADITLNLDKIQEWCEKLLHIILITRQIVKDEESLRLKLKVYSQEVSDTSSLLSDKIPHMLSILVTSTFVIERQPLQVIKTNSKVTATLRFLIGRKLNLRPTYPEVTASIINEAQANTLLQRQMNFMRQCSGELQNNTELMQMKENSKYMFACFTKMQLKRIKRSDKKGTECVMDEKFSLLFQSQFSVGDGFVFQVWTLSLPVVVVVHGSQDPYAWATVTWDNAFCDPGRRPFEVPNQEFWPRVAETISMKFKGSAGSYLSAQALKFLAQKAFRSHHEDFSDQMLSFNKFCKDFLPDRHFTFWEWFYAAMKLTREHLRDLWKEGLIMGFVQKRKAEDILTICPKGTFLLRFSDSELGGITIAWVGEHREVYMLQPFTNKDFAIRSLPDRISDLHHLISVYPGIPKDQAFGKFYTPFRDNSNKSVNGYVKPVLVTHVPGLNDPGSQSYPHSPQIYSFSPETCDARGTDATSFS